MYDMEDCWGKKFFVVHIIPNDWQLIHRVKFALNLRD